jgi:hypothetical protein
MPKLGQYTRILETVFFLYENREHALAGTESGGTGFLVSVPSKRWPQHVNHVHGITNWHVAVHGQDSPPTPVIRLNRLDGTAEPIEFDVSQWIFRPGMYDVAITPPLDIDAPQYKIAFLDVASYFLTAQEEQKDEIGPADDVFMIGRFVDYDGVETNAPAARFGHISIINANIEQPTGYRGRSIVLDMHSRSGFSGSPVFVYRTIGSHFFESAPGKVLMGGGHYFKLLGMHWGQFPEAWELRTGKSRPVARHAALITDGQYVEGLSGMTCAIPAAHIADVLATKELEDMREHREIKIEKS